MATETDIRLRSWLDTNQRDREQMCRAVLALDPHYSDVRPRHPSGGPDGGRDIEAVYDGSRIAYGAVGFQNGANDSDQQRRRIRAKFTSDLASATGAKNDLKVFAFFTNLNLALGEQAKMKEEARRVGIEHCDILDRERLRIELDSPAGFFIRFQYLGLPLSEAEQASFLARYGDRIQEVVSTGFQRIEHTLNRILFLQEANGVLDGVYVRFRLKKIYPASEIGHFRAFVSVQLRAVTLDIMRLWFGSTDKSDRFREDVKVKRNCPGIANGIGSGQWEEHFRLPVRDEQGIVRQETTTVGSLEEDDDDEAEPELVQVGAGSSVGMDQVQSITAHYSHDDFIIRFRPRLQLSDLDECMFMPVLNKSLAEKLMCIEVFANEYKLAHIGLEDFTIDSSKFKVKMSQAFSPDELSDPWVRIRPSGGFSAFQLRFTSNTPRRLFEHQETPEL
ncbi:MAG: hypothetical protein U1G05_00060 [Kiritimatiellia bacterium]